MLSDCTGGGRVAEHEARVCGITSGTAHSSRGDHVNVRSCKLRLLGAAVGLTLIVGFAAPSVSAAAEVVTAEDVTVDDATYAALADDGTADVIVRLREQADLEQVAEQAADVAADPTAWSVLDEVRHLLAGITGTVQDLASAARVATVVNALQETVAASAGDVAALLHEREETGQITDVQEFWIFNGFAANIDADTLAALVEHPDVASVTYDEVIELADGEVRPHGGVTELASLGLLATQQTRAWGVERVGAPQVWDKHDTRGDGAVVGILDSGVDASHPALADTWRGSSDDPAKSWYVPTGESYSTPGDRRGHGTHVTGTIVGETSNETTGVAPEAEWIAAKIFRDNGTSTVSIIHAGMEWMLAPGGDPSEAPDVVNNSWGTNDTYVTEFWHNIDAWIAAGIVPVFAVGNRGPQAGSLSSPASFPHAIAIGATDTGDRVAQFSGRGPVTWDGTSYVKPDLVAPGVRVRSASNNGGYRVMTGTSMATPHVSGVIALMRSVDPNLTVNEIRDILEQTARGGVDSDSDGHGLVDALAAVNAAAD